MQSSRRTLTVNTTLPPIAHAALLVLAERSAMGGRRNVSLTLLALIFAEVERLSPGAWVDAYAAAWEAASPAEQSDAAAAVLRKALGLPPRPAGGSPTIQDVDCPTSPRLPDQAIRASQLEAIVACPLRAHHGKLNGRPCPGGCGA